MSPRLVPSDLLQELILETPSKIVLFVVDGLGGLPDPKSGRTELESARTPNLDGLSHRLGDTDPRQTGVPPHPSTPPEPGAAATADLLNRWVAAAREALADEHPANMVLLRGFARHPDLGRFDQRYKLRAGAVAV